ncbi:RloB family protein [Streptococcus mitis]|uniref:RloB family protein n=1 Tax=Streptococcus mitis TaxID=28037 RepID=UPI0021B53CAC|nr:RloB family protein [Streptococcus mitis]
MSRGRQSKGRALKKTIYIFTEGETEKNYFSILNKKYNATVTVKVSVNHAHKQGMNLLTHALGKINTLTNTEKRNLGGVYIIFDKDDIDNAEMQTVLSEAKSKGIHIGFSNSCFEVWLLAHFEKLNESHTKDRLYQRLEHHLNCKQYSKKHKNDIDLLKKIEDCVSTAMENTATMKELSQITINCEPYTNIGKVIQCIYNRDMY